MSLCFISMQGIVISTQGSRNHTSYLAERRMWIFPKCIMYSGGRVFCFIITCTNLNTFCVKIVRLGAVPSCIMQGWQPQIYIASVWFDLIYYYIQADAVLLWYIHWMYNTSYINFFILVTNELNAQNCCFTTSLFHASTCFVQHVLIITRSKLNYTASGIITHIGGHPVHRLREDHSSEMHGQQNINKILHPIVNIYIHI